jgi:hypothetical protein
MYFIVDYKSPEETKKMVVEEYQKASAVAKKLDLGK